MATLMGGGEVEGASAVARGCALLQSRKRADLDSLFCCDHWPTTNALTDSDSPTTPLAHTYPHLPTCICSEKDFTHPTAACLAATKKCLQYVPSPLDPYNVLAPTCHDDESLDSGRLAAHKRGVLTGAEADAEVCHIRRLKPSTAASSP